MSVQRLELEVVAVASQGERGPLDRALFDEMCGRIAHLIAEERYQDLDPYCAWSPEPDFGDSGQTPD